MGKSLIIAEKPSAARAYADALGGFTRKNGYLESDKYYISWAVGHLIGLAMPEEYSEELKVWRMETLPFIPDEFKLSVLPNTKEQLKIIYNLAKKASSLVVATDAGREGELIARLIIQYLKIDLPSQRLWISSLTQEAIQEGFENLKADAEYDSLYQAARCRAEGDYLIGINLSRAFTVKYHTTLSLGRVQTPVLKLLVKRQEEIDNFKPEPYWELDLDFQEGYQGKWFKDKTDRFMKKELAEATLAKVQDQKGVVQKAEAKNSKENPPLPFDLTTLQREANRHFGYTAQETLNIAQKLYESKLISYPRTDSRYLTKDLLPSLPRIASKLKSFYAGELPKQITASHRAVNDKKVNDHHALIPTGVLPKGSLSEKEKNIYRMVAIRFLVQFFPEAVYKELQLITEVLGETFKTSTKVLTKKGWRELEGNKEVADISPALSKIKAGMEVESLSGKIVEKKTVPPKNYTEATLLGTMERPKLEEGAVYSQDMLDLLKEHGLGTPATRASIIERLKKIGYITAKGKSLLPTQKGVQLIQRVEDIGAEVLASPEMTGEWEKKINDIYLHGYSPLQFKEEIEELTRNLIGKIKKETELAEGQQLVCPNCGRPMTEFMTNWSCSGYRESCKFTLWKNIAQRKLAIGEAKELLDKKRVGPLNGFISKKGTEFSTVLILKDGKVEFDFSK